MLESLRLSESGNKTAGALKVIVAVIFALIFSVSAVMAYAVEQTTYVYISPGETKTYSGTVQSSYKDVYKIMSLSAGQTLTVTLQTTSGDADLRVWTPDFNQYWVSMAAGTRTDSLTVDITQDGNWWVDVEGFLESSYTLTISLSGAAPETTPTPTPSVSDPYEPNDGRLSAKRIAPGTTSSEAYLGSNDEDWFYFTILAYSHVVIETVNSPGFPNANTVMTLYNSVGAEIDSDDDGGEGTFSKIERDLTGGTYYIRIRPCNSYTTGYYALRVTASGLVQTTTTVAPSPSNPDPEIVSANAEPPATESDTFDIYITVRNDGDSGTVSVWSNIGGRSYSETFYLESGRSRTVVFRIPQPLPTGTWTIYTGYSGIYTDSVTLTISAPEVVVTTPTVTQPPYYYEPTPTSTPATGGIGGAVPEEFSQFSKWAWNSTIVPWVINPIGTIINTITSGINTIISTIVSGLSGIISAVFTPIADALSAVGNAIVSVINTIADAIRGVLSSFFYGGGE